MGRFERLLVGVLLGHLPLNVLQRVLLVLGELSNSAVIASLRRV